MYSSCIIIISDNPDCVSGFLTATEVVAKSDFLVRPSLVNTELSQPVNQRMLIQALSFSCSGAITSITFTAKQGSGISYPFLQVWAQNRTNSNLYSRRGQVSLAGSFLESLNTYKLQLVEPLLVESGDVVGLLLPALETAAILLQFERGTQSVGSNNSSVNSYSSSLSPFDSYFDISSSAVLLDNAQPLLQVEMGKFNTASPFPLLATKFCT